MLNAIALAILVMASSGRAEDVPQPREPTPSKENVAKDPSDILNLDIEQLAKTPVVVPSMDIPVVSVTKEPSTVGRSAAAVFVITNEMIRRSGATCIPEALRMAPGLDVARINSNTWAISSRGFNGLYANKLLVLIDGRTVYTPVSSGVYWDVQDVVLEDVDRIEVIRGPGGTLWGANAVNGVINILTKKAKDTQGAYVSAGGGTFERSSEIARYGGKIGDDGYYRVYGKYFDRAPGYDPTGSAYDAWNQGRVGFRADWDLNQSQTDSLTVQGDHYVGQSGMTADFTTTLAPYFYNMAGEIRNTGENVLLRYKHEFDADADWSLQTYFDHFDRNTILYSEDVRTYDIELQYRYRVNDRHQITCGAGYRYIDYFCPSESVFTASILPAEQNSCVVNEFIQDEISLAPDLLGLIVGCKLEQNTFTGFEYEPSIRLLLTPDHKHTLWGAVSRAVRTPSLSNESLFDTHAPRTDALFTRYLGSQDFKSETLIAYELGYRTQATDKFSWDIATFYNDYDDVATFDAGKIFVEQYPSPAHLVLPFMYANGSSANTYGVELATDWTVSERWRLSSQYTFLQAVESSAAVSTSPRHQVGLRSSWNLRKDLDFDITARYVDCLASLDVPSYITMDARLAWRPKQHLELALVGQNLLQAHHWEYGQLFAFPGYQITEVPMGVYGTVAWRY